MATWPETRDVLALVRQWNVSETQLRNDIRDGFLPSADIEYPGDGRVQVGRWSSLAVRRAKRLYRLRRRGAKGEYLRVLLFLADGYGWGDLKETALIGFDKMSAASLSGFDRYARGKDPDRFALDEIRAHQQRLVAGALPEGTEVSQTSEETTLFVLGVLRDGIPLEGGSGRRVVKPIIGFLRPDLPPSVAAFWTWLFDVLVGWLLPSRSRLRSFIENADEAQVEHARIRYLQLARQLRRAARSRLGATYPNQSYNPLTFCGQAGQIEPANFAKNPWRVTGPQVLAATYALSLALDIAFETAANTAMSLLQTLLRTSKTQ